MNFVVSNKNKENIINLMRRIQYSFQREDIDTEDKSFVRILSSSNYPRFHLFVKKEGENLSFNLHIDKIKPVHKGAKAHQGEYEGELVQEERERIERILNQ